MKFKMFFFLKEKTVDWNVKDMDFFGRANLNTFAFHRDLVIC